MEDFNFLVRVSCMTYNQAHYIVDAMNGFCMQETSFPFVCTIVDDASTDGEQEVIQDYLNKYFILDGNEDYHHNETEDYVRFFARHKTNSNCYFVVVYLKYNHYSIKKPKAPYFKEWTNTKYVACCEGDDYWIDSKKLQMQVDFMESHPDYSLCCHRIYKYDENLNKIEEDNFANLFKNESKVYTFDKNENNSRWFTQTQSVLYRSSAYNNDFLSRFKYRRDVHIFYSILCQGKGGLLQFLGAVYRRNSGGIYALTSDYSKAQKGYMIFKELDAYYNDKALYKQACYYYNKFYTCANKNEKRVLLKDWYDFRVLMHVLTVRVYILLFKHN